MAADDLIPLSRLEAELGISRVDLLLLIRRLGLEPVRRGMRTYLSVADASTLAGRSAAENTEAVAAELVFDEPQISALPVSVDSSWIKAELYADLRLFRERLDILERLIRTGIEVDSRELADLLQLKRLPVLQQGADELENMLFFDRQGMRFLRMSRPGQRHTWRIIGTLSSA